jgi:hypothetical protein
LFQHQTANDIRKKNQFSVVFCVHH